MSFVQQVAPTLLAPGVHVRMACATIVPGFGWVTVEPTWNVMFALLGDRAEAGAEKAALTAATMTIPMRILHLRILENVHLPQGRFKAQRRTCQLAARVGGWHTARFTGSARRRRRPRRTRMSALRRRTSRSGATTPGVGGLEIG